MNVKLTPHAVELLEAMQRRGHEPMEVILEHALEVLVREEGTLAQKRSSTSVLELQGLGKEIWDGLDAQQYVNSERASWNG